MIQDFEVFKAKFEKIVEEDANEVLLDKLCCQWIEGAIDAIAEKDREKGKVLFNVIKEHFLPIKV
jgi:hypothetical protein